MTSAERLRLLALGIVIGNLLVSCRGQTQSCTVSWNGSYHPPAADIPEGDAQLFQVALNLEYLEAEFFLWGSHGHGLDDVYPALADGGPSPKGGQKANLDSFTRDVIAQFAYQEVGHLRAIRDTLRDSAFPRPLIDISKQSWARIFDEALGVKLQPPFDVYGNSINYWLAAYAIPYVGLTGYVGANPNLKSSASKRLLAGLLGVESGQDAVIRGYLYQHASSRVYPYEMTVADVTQRLSSLRSQLARSKVDDEGLVVPFCLGAEMNVSGNVLVGDPYSVSYARTPSQVLAVVYGTGNASCPGGFFPKGGSGVIARSLICTACGCNPNRVPATA